MEKRITPNNTYIYDALSNGKVCRWKKSVIKFYIDYSGLGPYSDCDKITLKIIDSFDCWEKALKGKLHFEQTSNLRDADITICFRRNQGIGTIGLCEFTKVHYDGEFKKINIKIGLISPSKIQQTMIHEIGHAIGIYNHSPNENDIMFCYQNLKNMTISQKDIDTVNLLYSLPVGMQTKEIEAIYKKAELPLPNKQKINTNKTNIRNLECETKKLAEARLLEFTQQYIDLNKGTENIIKIFCSKKCYSF